MRILFNKTDVLGKGKVYIVTEDRYITYVGETKPEGEFDRVINTKNKLIMPGLYNCHTHIAMQFLRGYGEDLQLERWLNEKIFPAEEKLTPEIVSYCSEIAIAEMIRNGIVSFSDMYFFCDRTAEVIGKTGIKGNISRSIVSFNNNADFSSDYRFTEAKELFEKYNNSFDGRLKIDLSLHAEYTNVSGMVEYCAEYAKSNNAAFNIHLSETEKEHNECIARHKMTPAAFFEKHGVLDSPTSLAHCVWVSDDDMDILKRHNATVVHNPSSNLKLGSGVMRLSKMLEKGINVTLGTDSSASNNRLDILREMYLASVLQKGVDRDPAKVKANRIIELATVNGAKAQRRPDCGAIEVGKKADIIMIDLDSVNNIPCYDPVYSVVYSANSSDVCFNMVDGIILYENGEYTTIDIEKVKYGIKNIVSTIFN